MLKNTLLAPIREVHNKKENIVLLCNSPNSKYKQSVQLLSPSTPSVMFEKKSFKEINFLFQADQTPRQSRQLHVHKIVKGELAL